jgi:hypothetical protein
MDRSSTDGSAKIDEDKAGIPSGFCGGAAQNSTSDKGRGDKNFQTSIQRNGQFNSAARRQEESTCYSKKSPGGRIQLSSRETRDPAEQEPKTATRDFKLGKKWQNKRTDERADRQSSAFTAPQENSRL